MSAKYPKELATDRACQAKGARTAKALKPEQADVVEGWLEDGLDLGERGVLGERKVVKKAGGRFCRA